MNDNATAATIDSATQRPAYRLARALPLQVRDHVAISFEEHLYAQALSMLTQCLTAGTDGPIAACVPSTDILTLIATLTVHPSMTTRTTSPDKQHAADQALHYLRLLNNLVGPSLSGLSAAFRFSDLNQSRSGRVKQRSLLKDHESDMSSDRLNSIYAKNESLWTSAGDVWSVIGWAFNCSIIHKHRWQRWKLLLSVLIDVLAADFEDALLLQASSSAHQGSRDNQSSAIERTLLYQYLARSGDGRQQRRRILRALLADGSERSVAEFGEVWKDEAAPPRPKTDQQREHKKLDLDNDQYGDYDSRSDDDLFLSPQDAIIAESLESRASTSSPAGVTAGEPLGDSTCLSLRQRLLSLLLRFSSTSPDAFLDLEELLDLYAENFRGISFRAFQQLLFPPSHFLDPSTRCYLNRALLRQMLDSKTSVYVVDTLTQQDFEELFAPSAAQLSNATDNAKVSLIVEDLLRSLWKAQVLTCSRHLREAVTLGITRRHEKARPDGRRRTAAASQEDRECRQELRMSGERMLCIVDMLQ